MGGYRGDSIIQPRLGRMDATQPCDQPNGAAKSDQAVVHWYLILIVTMPERQNNYSAGRHAFPQFCVCMFVHW